MFNQNQNLDIHLLCGEICPLEDLSWRQDQAHEEIYLHRIFGPPKLDLRSFVIGAANRATVPELRVLFSNLDVDASHSNAGEKRG